ncbi:MAG: hypothetical protein IT463_04330 [Planctomycetes bacterium]|nr:hypothetical protein [Planctomycetota bacterium]
MALLLVPALHAEGETAPQPDLAGQARTALKTGAGNAASLAAKALKANPLGSAENTNAALAMFWLGQFEDSARYLRRALAADPDALAGLARLDTLVPARDINPRLAELADRVERDADLCFLAGCLLLLNDDATRALPLLVRAEELAGADAQASRLAGRATGSTGADRAHLRALAALRDNEPAEAARSFAFAAMDTPTAVENYAGLALCSLLSGNRDGALRMFELAQARTQTTRMLDWLRTLQPPMPVTHTAAKALEAQPGPGKGGLQLAMLAYVAAGCFDSAAEASVRVLLADKLDDLAHDLRRFMDQHGLKGNPPGLEAAQPVVPQPVDPTPGTGTEPPAEPGLPAAEQARRLLKRSEFTEAAKVLEPLATEEQEDAEVFFLLFVALVGRAEPQEAASALQVWFLRADDKRRMKLNAVRELFPRNEHDTRWKQQVLALRDADANAALPRLLLCYVEAAAGNYAAARSELAVALLTERGNPTLRELNRLLKLDSYQENVTPGTIPDAPTPRALLGRATAAFERGEYETALSDLLAAQEGDPAMKELAPALVRVHFALGDYQRAARAVERLLAEQQVAAKGARALDFSMVAGYGQNTAAFAGHVKALQDACAARFSPVDECLVLGFLRFTQGDYSAARDALQNWSDSNLEYKKDLNAGVLKLLEYAAKEAK